MKKLLSLLLVLCLALSLGGGVLAASGEPVGELSPLVLSDPAWELSEDASYYALMNVPYCTNVVSPQYQYMNIYVPAVYMHGGSVDGYTAETAPIVLLNNCMGWMSSSPGAVNEEYIAEGFVYVSCGARSRGAGENGEGKAPAPVVDLKSAVRTLRLNADVIPGDENKIVSVGTSGGGQMSSILGASGNMDEYYPYLYENGAAGIELVDGRYVSTIKDDVYAAMCYCPITDIENADLAYAWTRYGIGETGGMTMFSDEFSFQEFHMALQEDMAIAYCEYINGLGLVNAEGEALTFDLKPDGSPDPRSGSFYDQILENISASLNAWIEGEGYAEGSSGEMAGGFEAYYATLTEPESWLKQNADGSWSVTDLDGFLTGTDLARNKDIPGFDTFLLDAENNAFGTKYEEAVHYSASVASVLEEHYNEYVEMAGAENYDLLNYIGQAKREDIVYQTSLMNSTHILLAVAAGEQESDFAPYWRTRNGTADEHTSFSVAYNLAMAAQMAGAESVDYSLVWEMVHGNIEGTTTGTFAEWVHEICGGAPSAPMSLGTMIADLAAAPAVAGETEGAAESVYIYEETNAFGIPIVWTLELGADGSYALSEENTVVGKATYTGTYTASGSTVVCSAMKEAGPAIYDWARPSGFTVTAADGAFTPGA